MPSKYVLRSFEEQGYYHVFNRGVEKRDLFLDEQDYHLFLYYLYIYATPLKEVLNKYPELPMRLYPKNLASDIEILAFCLMPNHFHLLIKNITRDGTSKLLKQVTNAYTLYFNQKYKRVGGLVQGRFKAAPIRIENTLLHISRYIHLNPLVAGLVSDLESYPWSSFKSYISLEDTFAKKETVLSFFNSPNAYKDFVLDHADYAKQLEYIKHLAIDTEN